MMGKRTEGCLGAVARARVLALVCVLLAGGIAGLASTVEVDGDEGFVLVPGVTGSGTVADPYVLTGQFDAEGEPFALHISNTTAHFVIRDSVFRGAADAGLRLENVVNGWVVASVFEGNGVGVRTEGVTAEVTFVANTFRGNSPHVAAQALSTRWDDGQVGNWWEGYAGTDENGDGKGAAPYEIAPATEQRAAQTDRFPLVSPLAGIEPPEGAVLLAVIHNVGELYWTTFDLEMEFSMDIMGMRMPMFMETQMLVEEEIVEKYGGGNHFHVRSTIIEDEGTVIVMGSPEEYLSDEGVEYTTRLHWLGGFEEIEGEAPVSGGVPLEGIGWPARWLTVGDTWTHEWEESAEELGIPEGAGLYRMTVTFIRLEDRDGRQVAVFLNEGDLQVEGYEDDPFVGRMNFVADGTFAFLNQVDVVTGRAIEESAEISLSGTISAMGERVGGIATAMAWTARDVPVDIPDETPVVTSVQRARGLAVISLGSIHGVSPEDQFEVYHVVQLADGTELEEYRGLIEVQEVVSRDRAVCRILEEVVPIEVGNQLRPVEGADEATD